MHARDRQLLAGLARTNTEIGQVVVELLSLQDSDEKYAAGLRTIGRQLVQIGAQLAARAGELDGLVLGPAELLAGQQTEPGTEAP